MSSVHRPLYTQTRAVVHTARQVPHPHPHLPRGLYDAEDRVAAAALCGPGNPLQPEEADGAQGTRGLVGLSSGAPIGQASAMCCRGHVGECAGGRGVSSPRTFLARPGCETIPLPVSVPIMLSASLGGCLCLLSILMLLQLCFGLCPSVCTSLPVTVSLVQFPTLHLSLSLRFIVSLSAYVSLSLSASLSSV